MKKLITAGAVIVLVGSAGVGTASVAAAASPSRTATAPAAASAPAAKPAPYVPPAPKWAACTGPNLKRAGAECALVTVPLDYAKPAGAKIKIAVSRIKAKKGAPYRGPILVNPGGPGGSGLALSQLGALVPDQGGAGYDWIGFDPRGVGSSQPKLTCRGDYVSYNRPDYRVRTAAQKKAWLAKAKAYAAACAKSPGAALLPHIKTTDNVKDMESIRQALRAPKLNYYGFSYGTYLGQVYATTYPDKVGRMVLDSNVDPRKVWYQANLDQDVAFNTAISRFFGWVAANDATYHLGKRGSQVSRSFYTALDRLSRRPASNGTIGPDEFTDVFTNAGYNVGYWPTAGRVLSRAVRNGDYSVAKKAFDAANPQGPGTDNTFAVYNATQCTDVQWPKSWSTWQRDNERVYAKAPFMTWSNVWFNAPCLFWPAKAASQAPVVDGRSAPPVLLLSETADAATPFSGSLEVRRRFPNSVLVEGVGGTTHASSLNGVACYDDTVAAYLKNGTLPARTRGEGHADKKCPAMPIPKASMTPAAN